MPDRTHLVLLAVCALFVACGLDSADRAGRVTDVAAVRTHAEESEFRATGDYAETIELAELFASASPEIELAYFGRSGAGREMPVVIVSKDRTFTPEAARRAGTPIVLIQSGIHSGEIDGKDATLILLREIAAGERDELLDAGTILFVPIYNVDGHERVSPFHRANQNGPVEGMGFRTNAQGLDLNRDHLKLKSVEARALIELVNVWDPHLHVDNHVTNGSDHDWILTYSFVEAPQMPEPIDAWLGGAMAAVVDATREAGHASGPYVSLRNPNDPLQGFDSWVGLPRYSSGYFPLRNVPSILIEMHAHKEYGPRVRANHAFLVALLEELTRSGGALIEAVETSRERTATLGRADADASEIVIQYESDDRGETITWPAYAWHIEQSQLFGSFLKFAPGESRSVKVPWIHESRAAKIASRPRGYLILPGWPQISETIAAQGLVMHRVNREAALDVETIRIENPQFASTSYQGLTRVTGEVARQMEQREIPHGSYWVPADQPNFEIAVQLLEPDAPDSLFSWGLLSSVVERKEYISTERLDELVQEMLNDEETAREWHESLRDEEFARDRSAIFLWWYKRTPYWDETVGLMPVYRVMSAPDFKTVP